MRNLFLILLPFVCISPLSAQEPILINRHSVQLFEHIPDTFLQIAKETKMMFSDRSVGQNINEALDNFQAASWAQTPASARRDYTDTLWNWKTFTAADLAAGIVPERIQFNPDPIKYNRSNWVFEEKSGSWSELTGDFIQNLGPAYEDQAQVWSYQFSYLNVTENDDIAHPGTGFFSDNPGKYDIHDLEAYLAQHPDITFFFWTSSLARGIGNSVSTEFNDQMRLYCQENGKILFDMADIISHTDQGIACYDNRDGIPYTAMSGQYENHPDDGFDYPAICQDYTTETEGGHLGSVSAGKVRMAKAFWVLMARIAGWDGKVGSEPAPMIDPEHRFNYASFSLAGMQMQRYRFAEVDTMLGNDAYRPLQISYEPIGNNWTDLPRYYKEDGGKVWLYNEPEDVLLYDFTAALGDTVRLTSLMGDLQPFVVREVDTVVILNGSSRKRMTLTCPDDPDGNWYGPMIWIEGIGNTTANPFYPEGYCATDISGLLTCFYDGEELHFQNPGASDCWLTTGIEQEQKPSQWELFPNPVAHTLWVRHPNIAQVHISVFSIAGQVIPLEMSTPGELDVSFLPAGAYFLHIKAEDGSNQILRFIKLGRQ